MSKNIEKSKFEVNDVDHEIVEKYKPKFLARGGEHIVYEMVDHPNVVVKVDTHVMKRIIDWNAQHDNPINNLPEEIKLAAHDHLKSVRARYLNMKKYFGDEHVLNQKQFLIKVPITEDILNSIYNDNPPAHGNEAWSVVMVQRRAKEVDDQNHLTLVSGYVEENETLDPGLYSKVTDYLIFENKPEAKLEENDFIAFQHNNTLWQLLELSKSDEDLKEVLTDLINKSVKYTEETGEILDLVGTDNIILFQNDGKWSYKLVDALYPGASNMIKDYFQPILVKLNDGKEIEQGEKNNIMNTLNYVRTINGLAELLGIQKKINIIPDGIKLNSNIFLKALKKS